MTVPFEIQQLLYLLIPIIMILLGIYLLVIHRRICKSCGRSIRPFWRECPCASEPPTVYYQEPEEEWDMRSVPETKPLFSDHIPMEGARIESTPEISPDTTPSPQDATSGEKGDIGSSPKVKPFSYDDAQPLSAEGFGTEVMLPSMSTAWLFIEESETPERRYEIEKKVISIGTSDDNDIILKDKAVSRHHAKIRIEREKFFIYDLASTNGTKVNDRKITKKWIKEGDRIELGHTRMTFRGEELPPEIPDYRHKPSDLLKI